MFQLILSLPFLGLFVIIWGVIGSFSKDPIQKEKSITLLKNTLMFFGVMFLVALGVCAMLLKGF